MDASFCIEPLKEAISLCGSPDYFNTDQGARFTSEAFASHLEGNEINISMYGKGRATDKVFNERFSRTIKYENSFAKGYGTEAHGCIGEYIQFHNQRRLHSWLYYQTLDMAYEGQITPPAVTIEVLERSCVMG